MKTKSGAIAIIGKPNVGKSTLLNRLVGEKIAGVSPKPQTTRMPIRGILTRRYKEKGNQSVTCQMVFIDTPGLHKPRDPLGRWMIKEIEKSLEGVDLIYWMVLPEIASPPRSVADRNDDAEPDSGQGIPRPSLRAAEGGEAISELIRNINIPVILLINQIDRFPKNDLIPALDYYHKLFPFKELIPISAKTGEQVELLIQKTLEHLPEGPLLFPEDQISDQKERDLAGEIIREKLYHFTGEEIPYSSTVIIEAFKEREDNIIEIHATLIVEKDSQKAIVIGKGGAKMKEIGQAARMDLEKFLGKRVFLKLWAKTQADWKREESSLRRLGYS